MDSLSAHRGRMIFLWAVLVSLNWFDVLATYIGVTVLEITKESNPFFQEINEGNYFWIIVLKILCLSLLYPFKRSCRYDSYTFLMIIAIFSYAILFWYHIFLFLFNI